MSLTKQYPTTQSPVISSQTAVAVINPAASPSGTLFSQRSFTNLSKDVPAFVATQFGIGTYLVILSMSVTDNPAATDKLPGLQVSTVTAIMVRTATRSKALRRRDPM